VRETHPGKTLRWFVSDEARVGQQGTLTRVWARTGTRPAVVKQCEYEWVYLWAAADPFSGDAISMVTPTVNTELMQTFVDGLSSHIKADEQAILVLDNAGWHRAKNLAWPENITPLFLPPYSPELNSAENLWQWLRSQYLSNQTFEDVDDLLQKTDAAWLELTPERIKTVCHCPWIVRANQT
jgi:transposase